MNSKIIAFDNKNMGENKLGCWTKFKSLFQDRGFDLEYEYNSTISLNVSDDTLSDVVRSTRSNDKVQTSATVDGEPPVAKNFYEQFATLGDNTKDNDLWRKSSTMHHRVSIRPSIYLTNIDEETSDADEDEFYDVSTYVRVGNMEYFG